MQAQRLLPFFRAYLCRAVCYDDVPEKIERTSEMSVLTFLVWKKGSVDC